MAGGRGPVGGRRFCLPGVRPASDVTGPETNWSKRTQQPQQTEATNAEAKHNSNIMPSVLASPSPIRRYGGSNYSNYTSSSAYSRSSTSYGGRTSSLDRSTYSSYVSSYKYASGTSGSSSKDYTSRPPIGSGALRNTTVAPSSIYRWFYLRWKHPAHPRHEDAVTQ